MISEPDVVIVGAGAAGIGAARRLADRGLSIVMLESMPRIGGRALTEKTPVGPLDLGCGWLHSASRNPWTTIADQAGYGIVRGESAWDKPFEGRGFSPAEQGEARRSFNEWAERINGAPPASDRASDALDLDGRWTAYLQAMSGFINGDELERVSAEDYGRYDAASTGQNWRVPEGYGALISGSLPKHNVQLLLSTPLTKLDLRERRPKLETDKGVLRPLAAIMTVSTAVLSGNAVTWPTELSSWREAATHLPLGNNEKLFLEIKGKSPFAPETRALGDARDPKTGVFYIRPFGRPVVECFLGGAGARAAAMHGHDAAFANAIDQLVSLFGSSIRKTIDPLVASDWTRAPSIGGAYSHALPGSAGARRSLARDFDQRIFFAGEATDLADFSTAHGAYNSGIRAADEALSAVLAQVRAR
ncbi:flavin monoamine oxidase family protein [Rhizobium lusitanum]|uniref:flavin monoamine oxidase family protein n=1 Tax=Rhizobium lusitanum TaxID=293958 RepID=UPI0015743D20|nr:FAD-dependent oxidoreductase [Rhizobium lusitanum]NTJ11518.1 FAD-dependent oxidoreductase [Rhizobium lusitanum]